MIQIGDVLVGRGDADSNESPHGRVWWTERWLSVTFDADTTFLVLSVENCMTGELELGVISLTTGLRLQLLISVVSITTKMSILRGKSFVVPESCGTVRP